MMLNRRVLAVVVLLGVALSPPVYGAGIPSHFQAFLKKHCVRCHGSQKEPQGDLRVDTLRGDIRVAGGETDVWGSILDRLQSGEMPPREEPRPTDTEREGAIYWLRTELRKVGHDDSEERHYPEKGNYLDHERLFDPSSQGVAATPARIWRISSFQYDQLMVRLVPAEKYKPIPNALGLTSDRGFRDYAFRYTVGEAETQQMLLNARYVLARVAQTDPRNNVLAKIARQEEPPSEDERQEAVAWLFEQLLLRDPTVDERERYGKLLAGSIERFGNKDGGVRGLAPVFVHPEVFIRSELGAGEPDKHGRMMLSPRELAFAIAFAITDCLPDEELIAATREGRLGTREDVRRQVERILNDKEIEKPRILRFFREYFSYDRAIDVFKDDYLLHTNKVPFSSLVEDTDQLILYVLAQDRDVLRELLTTNQSFVHHNLRPRAEKEIEQGKDLRRDRNFRGWLGTYYNLTADQWQPEQPITLPSSQRAGILTQPSWLIAHSNNVENQPIHRGKWIREHLLGGTIPDTPINVDAKLPDEPEHTLRERMRYTREAYCWSCHQRMNPLGLPFECFDQHGQFRSEEKVVTGEDRRGNPVWEGSRVDSSGAVSDSGDPSLDGPVNDAIELVHRLSRSERVHQMFVRHAFRYWMGRNETLDDAPTLQAAYQSYKESGGSMNALITSLLTSDSFLYRWPLAEQDVTVNGK